MKSTQTNAFRQFFVRVMVIACCAAVLIWFFYWAARMPSLHYETCKGNLHKIVVALHAYHDRYKTLPPAYVKGKDGKRLHSWRVLILPFLEEADLYAEYRMEEPWDGPNNRKLASRISKVYACPAHRDRRPASTNYVAIVSSVTAWPEHYPLTFGDIHDGNSMTIAVAETSDPNFHWMEPRDLTLEDAAEGVNPIERPGISSVHERDGKQGANIALFDGSVHFFYNTVDLQILKRLLTARNGKSFRDLSLPNVSFVKIGEIVDASKLKNTEVQPHLSMTIKSGSNYVYCATFQIAWDMLREELGADAIKLIGSPILANRLNAQQFDTLNLDSDSYVAMAGIAREEFIEKLKSERSAKLPKTSMRFPDADDKTLVAYAYLQKTLPFATPFPVFRKPVLFESASGKTPIACFGFEKLNPNSQGGYGQVTVCDYLNENDFVIQLGTRSDIIALAKIKCQSTLEQTLKAVQVRVRNGPATRSHLEHNETLAIPKLQFNVLREYDEITGIRLSDRPSWSIGKASQVIRFFLDETGATLESDAIVGVAMNGHDKPKINQPRRMVLDQPFLLYLQQRNAVEPYFVAWIGNTELLQKASE